MREYLIRRLLSMVVVLFGVTVVVFLLMNVIPGDVVQVMLGVEINPQLAATLRAELGLDQPILVRYWTWLTAALTGDLGASALTGLPVAGQLMQRLPVTIELAVVAVVLSLIVAVPVGIVSAVRRNSPLDVGLRVFSLAGISLPGFAIGLLLILFSSTVLHWFPPTGFIPIWEDPIGGVTQIILPAHALSVALTAGVSRMTRSAMLEVLRQDFIRTARSKGLAERVVVYLHALRNASIPIVTLSGMQIGILLGGSVVVEEVFGLPGVGRFLLSGIYQRDYPVVMGCVLTIAVIFLIVNLVVDLLYAWLDPRIRY